MFQIAFYKGTHSGIPGLYNRGVRWWTQSKYSHCELIFSDGMSASSSYMDGGVRFKRINYDPANWDIFPLPPELEAKAREWFVTHDGKPYDLWGNVHFVLSPVKHNSKAWFCSEAAAAALGFPESWRYDPALMYSVAISLMNRAAS